jgi:hypothetical protein
MYMQSAPGYGHFLKLQPGDSTEEETDITDVFSMKSYPGLSIFKPLAHLVSLEVISLF